MHVFFYCMKLNFWANLYTCYCFFCIKFEKCPNQWPFFTLPYAPMRGFFYKEQFSLNALYSKINFLIFSS